MKCSRFMVSVYRLIEAKRKRVSLLCRKIRRLKGSVEYSGRIGRLRAMVADVEEYAMPVFRR
jgi:hypothetical protein